MYTDDTTTVTTLARTRVACVLVQMTDQDCGHSRTPSGEVLVKMIDFQLKEMCVNEVNMLATFTPVHVFGMFYYCFANWKTIIA